MKLLIYNSLLKWAIQAIRVASWNKKGRKNLIGRVEFNEILASLSLFYIFQAQHHRKINVCGLHSSNHTCTGKYHQIMQYRVWQFFLKLPIWACTSTYVNYFLLIETLYRQQGRLNWKLNFVKCFHKIKLSYTITLELKYAYWRA